MADTRKRDYRAEYLRRKQLKLQRWQNAFFTAYISEMRAEGLGG